MTDTGQTARSQALDPRRVDQARILVAGAAAATLHRTATGTIFAYLDEYLATGGPPVATTLPLTDEPQHSPPGAVPAFFAGLLPEGRRLTNLRRRIKTSADDDFSLLLAVGSDPVGDVQVIPAQGSITGSTKAPTVAESDWADLDFGGLLAASGIVDPSALAGVQDKVSGRMLTLPLEHAGRAEILKLDPPEYPGLVRNEAFFLTVAAKLRQPVVQAQLIHDRNARSGLLIRRFDRVASPGGLRRLGVEDGAQLLGRYPADKYVPSTEALLDAVAAVCPARGVAIRAVLQQIALAWLTGNGDLHAKNISVLADRNADCVEWRVAPIYDIPSTLLYGDREMALTIAGRTDSLSHKRYLALADYAGLGASVAARALEEVLRVTVGIADQAAEALNCDPGQARTLRRVFERRHAVLAG